MLFAVEVEFGDELASSDADHPIPGLKLADNTKVESAVAGRFTCFLSDG